MPFHVNCPECRKKYAADERMLGKRIRCRQCSHVFTVETADSSSTSTMGKISASVTESPSVETTASSQPAVELPLRPIRTAPVRPSKGKGEWRETVPQPFAMSEALEAWTPLAIGLLVIIWIPALVFGDNRSGVAWAPIARIASFLVVYFLIVIPVTQSSIKDSFNKLRRALPLNPWMRVATTFALPATFAYVFSIVSGMTGFVVGCVLGLVLASVVFWLMFRLELAEMALPYAKASAAFFGSALLGVLLLIASARLLNNVMIGARAARGVRENPLGAQFAWVGPGGRSLRVAPVAEVAEPPAMTADPTAPPPSPAASSEPPPAAPTPDASQTPAAVDPNLPANPAAPAALPPADQPNNAFATPSPPRSGPLFEVEPGPADSDPFVVSIVNSHLPWVKSAYRPADQGIYEEAVSPVTPSPFVGLVRIAGIAGRTIESCRLAPVYHGTGSLPLGEEGADGNGSNGVRAMSPDGTVLLRLVSAEMPEAEVLPFAGLGSKVALAIPEELAKPADGGAPAVPELLGALPGNRFLLRWNTPEHSILQVYPYGAPEAQAPIAIRLGHSDTPSVFALSADGNSFAISERESDKPFLSIYRLTSPPIAPVTVPIATLQDTGDWDVTGVAFSRDGSKAAVLIEKNGQGIVRSWTLTDAMRSAEGLCSVPSANEMLGQTRGRALDWLTANTWLVHGRTVLNANTGSLIATLTSELVTGQQMVDERTAYLSYLGRDGHLHMAVVRFNPAILDGASNTTGAAKN